MNVLVLNSGSSSQKSALFAIPAGDLTEDPLKPLWKNEIEWKPGEENRKSAIRSLLGSIWSGPKAVLSGPEQIHGVGHRVVHGGRYLFDPTLLTPAVEKEISDAAKFAPLHNRSELEGVAIIRDLLGNVPQVAVFDTGFHRTLPPAAAMYPGPYEWLQQGIRRYGFHGINHQYCARRAPQLLKADPGTLKLISCHLGNGCSLAAINGGKSVDTTMGFTPLDGLMMGTRSGSLDPGILTFLMRESSGSAKQGSKDLDDTLNHKSGLLGISGVSGDMREIVKASKSGNERATLAFDMFVHHLRAGIAAMAASLGGVDAIVFTAGIGEHSPEVRTTTCEGLAFLGVKLDSAKNADSKADSIISVPDSRVIVLVIAAQEDWEIARQTSQLV